jgi:amino acid permease
MFGWMFAVMGLLFFIFWQAISISVIVSGRFLKQRKNYLFSFILACLACAAFPFGTILGVCTIIVLSRPAAKALYGWG